MEELARVESIADDLYREVRQLKKDGTYRTCYDAKPPLKGMQGRIQCMLLKQVKYPYYLMGGLADLLAPRDYVRNARVHAGARVMINEDVAQFFPSTSARVIFDIWKYVFHFPSDVAQTLTRLTTRQGELPEGAKTSSYLANLVFWAAEPRVVRILRSMGFTYTRYIDDMTISSRADKTSEELGEVLSLLASLVKRYGFRFKRNKHRIVYAGQRMEVTGLVVGRHSAGLVRAKRSNIRAQVHQCETEARNSLEQTPIQREVSSLVGQYTRLHPVQGQALRLRLDAILIQHRA